MGPPNEEFSKKLHNLLALNGFSVRREFSKLIIEKLTDEGLDLNLDEIIKKLCTNLEKQCISDQSIEKEHILKAINACFDDKCYENEKIFTVIPAFEFPRLKYSVDRKLYTISDRKGHLFGEANSKIELFRERYQTVLERTKRSIETIGTFNLQKIDYVLTLQRVKLEKTLILGALLQVNECKYFLEDPTGMVELDLTHAKYGNGFFVENSFILVAGTYEDRILYVTTIILPNSEDYSISQRSFGNINYFGGVSEVPLRHSERLKDHMGRNIADQMYIFSDFWLDNDQIMEKMDLLFSQLQTAPIAFVFLGNFMRESQNTSECIRMIREKLRIFAELIGKYTVIARTSHFVFVPGGNDPCTPYIMPRFGFPQFMSEPFKNLIPNAHFTTNPCRIQYCSREITIFRHNLAAKLLQATLNKPKCDQIGDWVIKTILSQGHLSPMSLNASTINWEYDYCLRLYPLSDFIIVGDSHSKYEQNINGCQVLNPGPFCESDFTFFAYKPATNTIEECDI